MPDTGRKVIVRTYSAGVFAGTLVARNGKDGPVTSAEFRVGGQVFMGYNGGPYFTFSEGFSLYVDCEDQAEVDEYWDKLVKAGAKPTQCGWIKDPFGISWQIGEPIKENLPEI